MPGFVHGRPALLTIVLAVILAIVLAAILTVVLAGLAVWIAAGRLLLCLRHGVQDAEIMFGVLEIALRHHTVAAAGRVAAELQIFFEQLLGGAAHP